jgi:YD repeat-containing protein
MENEGTFVSAPLLSQTSIVMTTTRLLSYLIYLMVGGLVSCSDHPFQPLVTPGSTANRLRVKTLTLDLPNNQAKVSSFRYDAQGRLSSIVAYQTPDSTVSDIQYSVYQYDGQNRLTGLRRSVLPYPRPQGNALNLIEQYTYSYNADGRVSEISHSGGLTWRFGYNSAGQLASGSVSYSHPRFSIQGSLAFTFTGNNLTQTVGGTSITYQGMPPGTSTGFPGVSTATYTYDDKLNPFYGVFVIPSPFGGPGNVLLSPSIPTAFFGGIDNVLHLSQNNVLTDIPPSGGFRESITYQYQYNAANLPTVRIKTSTAPAPNSTVTVETLRFEYESY